MATLILGMNQSLDGYVDHDAMPTNPQLFRHWIEHVQGLTGSVYGRRMYEIMRFFEEDDPAWSSDVQEFATAWRRLPKWVASRTQTSVGPNATLIEGDVASFIADLKARLDGEITIAGPQLAGQMADLVDEYRVYLHPVVLGGGTPFFTGPRPPLRLVATEPVGGDVIRLTYVPA